MSLAAPPTARRPGALARLRAAVDEVAAIDPGELDDPAFADDLLALRREMDRQDGVFASWAHAAHTRGVGARDGAASTAAWLRGRAGMREGEARSAIEAGEVTELLAAMGEAWRAGEISSGAARAMVSARVDGHDEKLRAVEGELLELARRGDVRTLRRACQHFRKLALADGTEPGARNGLYLAQTYDGVTALNGELEDLAGETVATAIHAYTDPPSTDDTRSTAQRRADALVRIAEVALAHFDNPEQRRVRKEVTVVLDWKTLTDRVPGRTDGEFTGPIHPRDIEALLCDCDISRVLTGPDSRPIDLGRKRRVVPPSLRRALVARDRGCGWPRCDRPPAWCDAHHLVPWSEGGTTDLDNCALLCPRHHRTGHRPGWRLELDEGVLRVYRPDGTEVT